MRLCGWVVVHFNTDRQHNISAALLRPIITPWCNYATLLPRRNTVAKASQAEAWGGRYKAMPPTHAAPVVCTLIDP